MGKGDKKTKRGKIFMGSYGVRRPNQPKKYIAPTFVEEVKTNAVGAEPVLVSEEKPKKVKKTADTVDVAVEEKPKAKKTPKKAKEEEKTDLFTETE